MHKSMMITSQSAGATIVLLPRMPENILTYIDIIKDIKEGEQKY